MNSFSECLNMALVSSKDKMILERPGFTQKIDLSMEHIFKEKIAEEEALDPQSMVD